MGVYALGGYALGVYALEGYALEGYALEGYALGGFPLGLVSLFGVFFHATLRLNGTAIERHVSMSTIFLALLLSIGSSLVSLSPDVSLSRDFDLDALVDVLSERDVRMVNRSDTDLRDGAAECVAMTTARSARFVACIHSTAADARTRIGRRSDYERAVFQRGAVVVYLRHGASPRIAHAVETVMEDE